MNRSVSNTPSMLVRAHSCRLVAAIVLLMGSTAMPALAADTPTIGGPGGGAFRLICANGMFLVGVTGRAGDFLDQVEPICATIDARGRWRGVLRTGPATGGSGGRSFTTLCQDNGVVVGFSGYAHKYVFNISLSCRRTGPNGVERRIALPVRVGGALNIGSTAGFDCGADRAAHGLVGGSGIYIDRIGLACAGFIGAVPTPARPPLADRPVAKTRMNLPRKGSRP
jgi:hypothetical protein